MTATVAISKDHARLRSIYSRAADMQKHGYDWREDDDGTLQDEVRELIERLPADVAQKARTAFAQLRAA
jgi:hypothetical protein